MPMDLPRNHFKRAIAASSGLADAPGPVPFGAWLMSGAPSTAEALGCAGFDFLVVDMEHVPIDTPQVIELLRALAGTPAAAVTRLPWNDMVMVKRALDAGAQTLMFPFVQSADDARRAVAYTRYPPEGVRGVAGMHRGARYGNVPGYLHAAAAELCVVVQIETADALGRLDAIAAVPGVDSIFVGPADLSASMGHLGDINHPAVQDRLAFAARECRRLKKPCGIIAFDPAMAARFVDYGYTWVAISSDLGLMVGRAQECLAAARAHAAASAPGGSPGTR
jgi:2-dehydro-3-deoxyglucarate aldolase/4-hydroxy-2-oxoheptanedioate aldolase